MSFLNALSAVRPPKPESKNPTGLLSMKFSPAMQTWLRDIKQPIFKYTAKPPVLQAKLDAVKEIAPELWKWGLCFAIISI